MNEKISKIVLILAGILVICLGISVGCFFGQIYAADKMETYCVDHSAIGTNEFSARGLTNAPGYMFWISGSTTEPYRQEMFIFRKELLWGMIDLERYVLQKQITGGNDQKVSSVRLDLKSPFEKGLLFIHTN